MSTKTEGKENSVKKEKLDPPTVENGEKGDLPGKEVKEEQPKKGCCKNFTCMGCIRSLWATQYTEDVKGNRELLIKTTVRELVVYLLFLITLCLITFGSTSSSTYYFNKALTDLFIESTVTNSRLNFKGITTIADFWNFARDPLLRGLFWNEWYNSDSPDKEAPGYIYYENKVLGITRLRQLRVGNSSCVVYSDFAEELNECYGSYSILKQDTKKFGPLMDDDTAWKYQTASAIDGFLHWGKLALYSGGGYIRALEQTKSEANETIKYLFKNRWIDRRTRIVFIDFSLFNANLNLFSAVRLTVEFPTVGGVIPAWYLRTMKLIRYTDIWDKFILACECLFVVFFLYYTVEEILELKRHKAAYFKVFWNWVDVILLLISLLCIVFNLYRELTSNRLLHSIVEKENKYADFDFIAYWKQQYNNLTAIAAFLAWSKIFKYIGFNKAMTQLSSTLGRCAADLFSFAVMFFIIFFAFAQLGYLMFGTQMSDFSTFTDSIFTLFRIIMGDFDFYQLQMAHRVLGPAFFILYVFFVFFVLLNMFLAIINDTYAVVKDEIANKAQEFAVADFIIESYNKMLEKVNFKNTQMVDIQNALQTADEDEDKQVDFNEWRKDLKERGYSDNEIETMFAKYDADGDRVLSEDEQMKIAEDLANERNALRKEIDEMQQDISSHESTMAAAAAMKGARVTIKDLTVLTQRIDHMEHSISSIVSKIDVILLKLEQVEKSKTNRRDILGKILDNITKSETTSDGMKADQMEKLIQEEIARWDLEDKKK